MAILDQNKRRVTVESGDTLWGISGAYLGDPTKYPTLAAINDISDPGLIYVGQEISLTDESGSSTKSTTSTVMKKPTIKQFGLQSNADNTLFATWTWNRSNTESYKVAWTYATGDGVAFNGNLSTITVDDDYPALARQSTYSIPNNATKVQFKVKPISKTYKKNDVETNYWDASWSDVKTWTVTTPLGVPGTPSVEINKFKLTATLDNIDIDGATHIEFQVIKDNSSSPFATKKAAITTSHASYAFTIGAGSQYKVRCRAYNSKNKTYSDWSKYSSNEGTIPSAPGSITEIKALSETSVYISWEAVENATGYGIEYTTKKMYFDSSTEVKSMTVTDATTHAEVTGMSSGEEYFFRVKATNSEGDSGWSEIKSVVIGETPAAPTTWSSTTTAATGNPVTLYWVHNAADGSSQTYAELQLYIGDTLEEYTIKNSEDEDEKDKNSQWVLDTSNYVEGTSVKWRVRTAGITKEYGEWSIQRSIDIYAPATLEMSITNNSGNLVETLTSFPFYVKAIAGPKTQAPIGYHLSIKSNEIYETVDNIGNSKTINKDEEVYAKYFDTNQALLAELSAGSIDLENNVEYTVTCTVSMNSGLTAEATSTFTVNWVEAQYIPNAEIGLDEDTMTANIRPYCENGELVYYQVNTETVLYKKTDTVFDFAFGEPVSDVTTTTGEQVYDGMSTSGYSGYFCPVDNGETVYYKVVIEPGVCVKSSTVLTSAWGNPISGAKTTTGEQVYDGVTTAGDSVFYCIVEEKTPVTGVLLSVYRREFDGSFTELATGLSSSKTTTIVDPHPALDYARYRIVAITEDTGAVGYYDLPGYPVGGKAVIIQWDEDWSSFETSEADELEQPPWSGSMLKLPYNIDVSDSHSPDISLIEYAGRSHPVSYYGTQLGTTATWNLEIEKDDKETLYGLRRLARWMGDVYVREPSGSGYWASITVSFSQKHCELTIPVTLSISQVEGGV